MLKAVNEQTKGAAAAKADPFDKLNGQVLERHETIGFAVGPTLARWADKLARFVQQMQDGTGAGGRFADKLKRIYQWARRNEGKIKAVVGAVGSLAVAFKAIKIARSVASEVGGAVRAVRGMPGRIDRALSRVRSVMRRILGGAGTSAGSAAASNAATSAASGIGPKMNKKGGKFAAAGRGTGKALGKGIGAGVLLVIPLLVWQFKNEIGKVVADNFEGFKSTGRKIGEALVNGVKDALTPSIRDLPGMGGPDPIGGFGQAGLPGIGGPDLRPRGSSPRTIGRPDRPA